MNYDTWKSTEPERDDTVAMCADCDGEQPIPTARREHDGAVLCDGCAAKRIEAEAWDRETILAEAADFTRRYGAMVTR